LSQGVTLFNNKVTVHVVTNLRDALFNGKQN